MSGKIERIGQPSAVWSLTAKDGVCKSRKATGLS